MLGYVFVFGFFYIVVNGFDDVPRGTVLLLFPSGYGYDRGRTTTTTTAFASRLAYAYETRRKR